MSSADWIELAIRCLSPFALGFIIGYVMNRHPLPRTKSPHIERHEQTRTQRERSR